MIRNAEDKQKSHRKLAKLEEEAFMHVQSTPSPPATADPSITELFAQRTPTPPDIPADFLKKLSEAEDMVNQLRRENESQREELAAIKHTVERDTRLKYKGCNHPTRPLRHRLGATSKSLDTREHSAGTSRIRANIRDYRSVSTSKIDVRQNERFPPLKAVSVSRVPR